MIKRVFTLLCVLASAALLTGCWNYREIESLLIVAGVAIDKSADGSGYHLTFEYVDLEGKSKETPIKSDILETHGSTVFEAVTNAKKAASNHLYWSNCQIIILSQDITREGIAETLDFFIRNNESRKTIEVLVARTPTAKEILRTKSLNNPIVSFELDKILETQTQRLSIASYTQLNFIFNTLSGKGRALLLPTIDVVNTDKGEKLAELSGDAVFNKDRLIGFLSPEETRYVMFVNDEIKGGILTGKIGDNKTNNYTFDIFKNRTRVKHKFINNALAIQITTSTVVSIGALETQVNYVDETQRKVFTENAENLLAESIENTVKRVQNDFGVDIFGFGEMISKKDPKLWKKLSEDWNEVFKNLAVEVKSDIIVRDSADSRNVLTVQ